MTMPHLDRNVVPSTPINIQGVNRIVRHVTSSGYKGAAFLLVFLALAGCNDQKYNSIIADRADQASKGVAASRQPEPPKSYNPLTVSDKAWAGDVSIRLRRGLPLPSKYERVHGVTVIAAEPMTLTEIANTISAQTGIPVRIAPGTAASAAAGSTSSAQSVTASMPLAYEGPLSGLLDQVSGSFGINWRYDGASINFSRFETRVFTIEALPGTETVKDGMQASSSGGSSGGSSGSSGGSGSSGSSSSTSLQQTTEMSAEFKVWEELDKTLVSILGGVGSVVVAPSGGTVTVTTTPDVMRTVAKFIEEENKRLSHQVAINVEVYSVSLADGTDFSFTFNEALRRLTNFGANYTGPSGPTGTGSYGQTGVSIIPGQSTGLATAIGTGAVTGGGNLAVAILNPNTVGQISGLFSALSAIGDTTRVTQFPLVTLNNRPVSRRIGQDLAYVASSSSTATLNVGTSSSVTPGILRLGFSLQLTPRVLEDGRIMLQYSLSLIDLLKMDNSFSGIQLPQTTTREFVQQALLKSGATLLLGGYDDEQIVQESQGVGSASNYLFGGGFSNQKTHTMLFIAITPQVVDTPHVEQN